MVSEYGKQDGGLFRLDIGIKPSLTDRQTDRVTERQIECRHYLEEEQYKKLALVFLVYCKKRNGDLSAKFFIHSVDCSWPIVGYLTIENDSVVEIVSGA